MCAPDPPDPYATAAAQSAANKDAVRESARMNQINETDPYGTKTWSGSYGQDISPEMEAQYLQQGKTPAEIEAMRAGNRSVKTSFSPEEQAKYDLMNRSIMGAGSHLENRLSQITDTPFSIDGVQERQLGGYRAGYNQGADLRSGIADAGAVSGSVADAGQIQRGLEDKGPVLRTFGASNPIQSSVGGADAATRNSVEDALYSRASARLDPQFTQAETDLDTKLANQGITLGSDAYTRAKSDFARDKSDAYAAARNDAITGGGAEQSRLFSLGLQQGEFANTAQAQDYGQKMGRASFYNTGQGQDFGQGVTEGQFVNSAQAQQRAQNEADTRLANEAQAQRWAQNAADAQFYNAAQLSEDERQRAQQSFYNDSRAMNENSVNSARNAQINELLLSRQQPLNEINSLLGRAQVNTPNFGSNAQYNVNAAPVGDYIMQGYQQKAANAGGLMGGLFSLGGSLGSAAILCWVAREVYGPTNSRWLHMRDWMLTKAPAALRDFYLKHGPMIAEFIKDKPEWKSRIHSAMEECLV